MQDNLKCSMACEEIDFECTRDTVSWMPRNEIGLMSLCGLRKIIHERRKPGKGHEPADWVFSQDRLLRKICRMEKRSNTR
jgi:hypothetical protein